MRPVKAILFEPACLADAQGTYEDVAPAFAELEAMGIQINAAGEPDETMYVTDNAAGLAKARAEGMIPILLMHDPDEAMRIVSKDPVGGVVSLLELPDFLRFLEAQRAQAGSLPNASLSAG